ncbi:hypothetical protein BASA81_011260 [Batrachochytrium salamandrivorans]|nr:hypothetical protein BASA81_011260 [Batrachochytrium salamandrivorans]
MPNARTVVTAVVVILGGMVLLANQREMGFLNEPLLPPVHTLEPTSESTFEPTPEPSKVIPITLEQCPSHDGKTTTRLEDYGDWLCSSQVLKPEPQPTLAEKDIPLDLYDSNTTSIMLLDGGDWGKMCNKMSIITGMLLELQAKSRLGSTVVALNPYFSAVLWTLDLERASQDVGGILMDCSYCGLRQSATRWATFRCTSLIVRGKVYSVSNHLFTKNETTWVGSMYWGFRFDTLGYDQRIMNALRPKPFLVDVVQAYIDSKRTKGVSMVSVHRRWIEGQCYEFVATPREYMCASGGLDLLTQPVTQLLQDKVVSKYYASTKRFVEMDQLHRRQYEPIAPALITCNFTLDREQFRLINQTWPMAFEREFDVLLATDGQAPQGDAALRGNPHARQICARVETGIGET